MCGFPHREGFTRSQVWVVREKSSSFSVNNAEK